MIGVLFLEKNGGDRVMAKTNKGVSRKAIRLYQKGYTIKDISRNIDKSRKTTTKILVDAGIHKVKSQLTPEERNEIIELLLAGSTLTGVASQLGLDRDYVRKLVYRTCDTYSVENDKLIDKSKPSKEKKVEASTEHKPTTKTILFSDKEKEGITTILLDAMIKSEEGNQILRNKGFMPVVREIEAAVEAIMN